MKDQGFFRNHKRNIIGAELILMNERHEWNGDLQLSKIHEGVNS